MDAPQTNITLRDLVQDARQRLRRLYPAEEADALTYALCRAVFGFSRTDVHLNGTQSVGDTTVWQQMLEALEQHCPLAYVTGTAPFYGLELHVGPGVLIPRPETEELVHWVLSDHPGRQPLSVLDMGTGSGCIALALASRRPDWKIHACDISDDALRIASGNARQLQLDVTFSKYDMLSSQACPAFAETPCLDVIISNPPYVTMEQKKDMRPNVLSFEPHAALFAPETDPVAFYRGIAGAACRFLRPEGSVYVEINEDLPEETCRIFQASGFSRVEPRKDLNGKWRMVRARR